MKPGILPAQWQTPALFWLVLGAGLLGGLLVKAAISAAGRAKPAG